MIKPKEEFKLIDDEKLEEVTGGEGNGDKEPFYCPHCQELLGHFYESQDDLRSICYNHHAKIFHPVR